MIKLIVQLAEFKIIGSKASSTQEGEDVYLTATVYDAGGKLLNTFDVCHGPEDPLTLYSIAPPPLSVASTVIEPKLVRQSG